MTGQPSPEATAEADGPAPVGDRAALTRHVETRYHARHRRQLPDLVKLAEMIEDIHESDPGVPEGLSVLLRRMASDLDARMTEEEQILFPAIRKGGAGPAVAAMRPDRGAQERDIALIRAISDGFELPESACTSWATLYRGLETFLDDLAEHTRLEDEILFAPADRPAGSVRGA